MACTRFPHALLSALILCMCSRAALAGGDTGVRDASGGTGVAQTEQTLAVDPTNPDNVVIGFINGASVSHDGGLTWALTSLACAGDNNPAFDRSGMAYFECDNNGVEFYRSNHASEPWTGPSNAVTFTESGGDLVDRPFLVRGTGATSLVVGWESFFTTPVGRVDVTVSNDGGATWSGRSRVDDPNDHPAQPDPRQFPAVGADGTIYVAYASGLAPFLDCRNCGALPTDYIVARSTDGGATFQRALVAANVARTDSPTEESEAITSLAADPDPARARHLALAWSDERSGESRIVASTSVDGGVTWSDLIEIAGPLDNDYPKQDHVQIAFAPDGRLIAVWRNSKASWGEYQLYARAFTFGSNGSLAPAPGPALQITDAPQQPNANAKSDEYLGMAVGPEGISVAWNQPRNGVAATTYRRIPLPAGTVDPFTFVERDNVATGAFVTSERKTLSAFAGTLPVSVSGGNSPQYSVDGGAFTSAAGTIAGGSTLVVRHISASSADTATVTSVTVGGYTTAFKSVTGSLDRTPDSFDFGSKTGQVANTPVESADIRLTGYNADLQIVPGPGIQYSLDGGVSYTAATGTLAAPAIGSLQGPPIRVRETSSPSHLGYAKGYLKIGGVTGYFTVRTQ